MNKLNLGFLVSHGGSNMQAIINNVKAGKLDANLCAMISNNKDAFALERARCENIPNFVINNTTHPNKTDEEIVRIFKEHSVDTVILAGYMKIVSEYLINNFNGRVLNIHPALLPKYGGKGMYGINVHRAVIENKELKSGVTVHLVNPEYDKGKILCQEIVNIECNYTPEMLAEKILSTEHKLYSETLIKIANGEIII